MKRFYYLLPVAVLFLIIGCGKSKTETKPKPKMDVVQPMNIEQPGDSDE